MVEKYVNTTIHMSLSLGNPLSLLVEVEEEVLQLVSYCEGWQEGDVKGGKLECQMGRCTVGGKVYCRCKGRG
jgi:hypothetical protein